jgi:hypothetical protein
MSSVQAINAQQKQQRLLQQQQPNFYNLQQQPIPQQPSNSMQQALPDVLSPDESEITALPRPPSSSSKKPVIKRKSALRLEASS